MMPRLISVVLHRVFSTLYLLFKVPHFLLLQRIFQIKRSQNIKQKSEEGFVSKENAKYFLGFWFRISTHCAGCMMLMMMVVGKRWSRRAENDVCALLQNEEDGLGLLGLGESE